MLSRLELEFLKTQGLTAEDVYDARNQSPKQWSEAARKAGKKVVLGTPCKEAGHRLRTRSNHCIQCDPAKLAYQNRHRSPGYVYIAGSESLGLLKIGTASDVEQRLRNLRNQNYGNASDWVMLFHVRVGQGGEIEGLAQRSLPKAQRRVVYVKDGKDQVAQELFKLTFTRVLKAVAEALGDRSRSDLWMAPKFVRASFEDPEPQNNEGNKT